MRDMQGKNMWGIARTILFRPKALVRIFFTMIALAFVVLLLANFSILRAVLFSSHVSLFDASELVWGIITSALLTIPALSWLLILTSSVLFGTERVLARAYRAPSPRFLKALADSLVCK